MFIGSYPEDDLSIDRMVELMLGRVCEAVGEKSVSYIRNETLLKVENLQYKNRLRNISLELKKEKFWELQDL